MGDKKFSNTYDANSSAENVEQHLLGLEDDEANEQRYYSQEQHFSSEELASVVNEERLNDLLAQGDEFLLGLSDEIKGFDGE